MVLKFIKKYWAVAFMIATGFAMVYHYDMVAGLGWFLAAVSSVAFIQSNDNLMDCIELAEDQNKTLYQVIEILRKENHGS